MDRRAERRSKRAGDQVRLDDAASAPADVRMSLAETARYLRVPRRKVVEAIEAGQLPARREGDDFIVDRRQVIALLSTPLRPQADRCDR